MKSFWLITLIFAATLSRAQIIHPKSSPFSTVIQEVGLTKITIAYSRPAARGRVLFGNQLNGEPGLVPYNRIWRVGANESTKITFDADVHIAGKKLKKGTYAMYAFPQETEWQIVFHKNLTHWGDGRDNYDSQEDALRVKIRPAESLDFQENFLISFDAIDHTKVNMLWNWGYKKIEIPILVNTAMLMREQIQEKLLGSPTAQTYYEIARYYQEENIHTEEALKFVNKAIELKGDTYYFYRVKSLILASLTNFGKAIEAAKVSMLLAEQEGKDEFVRLNKNNINTWSTIQNKH